MSGDNLLFFDRAAALRDAFDRSFAEARPPEPPPYEDLLAIRVAVQPYALRLSEIAGLFPDRKVTPVPGGVPGLVGLAGFRGAIVPVYDLHSLLGYGAAKATRWLAMAAGTSVAFAIETLEGHLRIALDAIVGQPADGSPRRHVREFARTPQALRPIVHLPAVIAALRRQVQANRSTQER